MDTTFDLRLYRKANGISQITVAEYLGVSKGFISQVETGRVALPEEKIHKLLNNDRGWSKEKYFDLLDTIDQMRRSPVVQMNSEVPVAAGEGDALLRVPLLPIFAQAGHLTGWSEGVMEAECERVTNILQWGQAFILDTKEGPLLKYLAPGTDEEHIKCISANHDPKYAPFEVSKDDILGIYRVVMCMKMM